MKHMKKVIGLLLIGALMLTAVPQHVMAAQQEAAETVTEQTGYQQPILIDVGEIEPEDVVAVTYEAYGDSEWDKYGNNYYYNQMNSQQKQFWNNLYNVASSFLASTNENAETYDYAGKTLYHMEYADAGSLSETETYNIATLFQISNPQFYFVNEYMFNGMMGSKRVCALGVYDDFSQGEIRSVYTEQIKNTVNSWINEINQESDLIAKEKKAHDMVCGAVVYDWNANYNQSCASVFLEGETVCAGYSEAFALLCNAIGIPTISVTSSTHEWNKVQLYDRWYAVDCTWDDGSDNTIYYDYFNTSDATQTAGNSDHNPESFFASYNVPSCDNDIVIEELLPIYDGVDYTAVFDATYYMEHNQDVKRAVGGDATKALEHFVKFGMKEGRQASDLFNVWAYRAKYADLRRAFGNDLKAYYMHYINNGKREGREATGSTTITNGITVYKGVDYSAVYNYQYYITQNPDIVEAYPNDDISALEYFVNYGMKEGQQASESFDVTSYYNAYPDLRRAFGKDWTKYYMHYINCGQKEGRNATGINELQGAVTVYNGVDYAAVYDYNTYISKNTDVARAYPNDDGAVLAHFVKCGMKEGRQASESFDVTSYYNAYPDLRNAFGRNWTKYYMHYMNYGKKEGRTATGVTSLQGAITVYNGVNYAAVYDYNTYISNNPDVKRAFGNDDCAVLAHFVRCGMKEGRQASTSFIVSIYKNRYSDLQKALGDNWKSYYIHYMNYGQKEGRTAV